ncbi:MULTISPECIES: fumarylacetoacetate hydrolase family protein [unclassified Variovorax]|uniref:fumarylacetoacetate hydrolase family protein n=1 Tax=unclassified Variovorax TaxID=663243 RepID=UPI001BD552B4|nr:MULTISPECIES: fumarylacetoacetate hydrolase family protein [unclassified Variovorax]
MDATRELLTWATHRNDPFWMDDPDQVQWLTPVPPKSMFSAGRNFGRHKMESMKGSAASASKLHSDFPTGFVKLGRTMVPHKSQVKRPKDVLDLDYEVEIVLVLGKAIDADSDVDPASAIFGYTIFNDLSAREWQLREMDNGMIMLGKNFPGFGPIGPYILTADEVPDPNGLVLWLKVNSELRQHSDCRDLIFGFEQMVAFWSRFGLVPGDMISTGTPEGVALHHKPDSRAWYLKPGDRVEAGVDSIGVLETFIV